MSRSNKPRCYRYRGRGGHSYVSKHFTWPKRNGNRRMRQEVNQQLKDLLFTDAFDEKEIRGRKRTQIFDRWSYD